MRSVAAARIAAMVSARFRCRVVRRGAGTPDFPRGAALDRRRGASA
jgi:hypothetical protein